MFLDRNKLNAVMTGVNTELMNVLATIKPSWQEWALGVPSTTTSESYVWARLLGAWREWLGPRLINAIKAYEWTVKNRKFEHTFSLTVDEINDMKVGMVPQFVRQCVEGGMNLPEDVLFDLALLAFTNNCYDDQIMIDTDHPSLTEDGTTWSNRDTRPFDYDNLIYVLDEWFGSIVGPNGRALDVEPTHVMVGPSLITKAKEFYTNQYKPGGEQLESQVRNRVKPVRNPRFIGAYANYWIVMGKLRGTNLTAFVWQDREKVERIACTALSATASVDGVEGMDPIQLLEDQVLFGGKARGEATFTLPELVWGSTGSGA